MNRNSHPTGFRRRCDATRPPTTAQLSGSTTPIGLAPSRLWMDPRLKTASAAVVAPNDTDSAARPHAAATAVRALPSIMARRYRLPGLLSMVVAPPSSPRLPLTSGRQSGCQDDHRRPACMLPRGGTALRTSNVSVGEG